MRDRRILLLKRVGAQAKGRKVAADIVLAVNIALSTRKFPTHIQLQRITFNEKGNLSALQGTTATRRMLLNTMRETILSPATEVDLNIIDTTGYQKRHRVHVYGKDLERYGREPRGMELI